MSAPSHIRPISVMAADEREAGLHLFVPTCGVCGLLITECRTCIAITGAGAIVRPFGALPALRPTHRITAVVEVTETDKYAAAEAVGIALMQQPGFRLAEVTHANELGELQRAVDAMILAQTFDARANALRQLRDLAAKWKATR